MTKKLLLLILASSSLTAFEYVDFDLSMHSDEYAHMLEQNNNKLQLKFFKTMYKKTEHASSTQEYQQRIPTIIHHVWFGKRLSDEFKQLRQTWIDMHQDWTFILWTDNAYNDSEATEARSFQELDDLLTSDDAKRIVVMSDMLAFDNRIHFDAADN